MYKLRVGNDINIQWRILRDGTPEDFAGKDLRILMRGTSCIRFNLPTLSSFEGSSRQGYEIKPLILRKLSSDKL